MVADAPDNYWNDGPAHDGGAQDPGERTVVLSDRIERQRNDNWPHHRSEQADRGERDHRHIRRPKQRGRETEERADTRADQYLAAVNIFSSNMPMEQPAVSSPQNQEIAVAPVV